MRVLVVYDLKVNDLYATGFDPVFRLEDSVQFAHGSVPEELLEEMNPAQTVLEMAGLPDPPADGEALAP